MSSSSRVLRSRTPVKTQHLKVEVAKSLDIEVPKKKSPRKRKDVKKEPTIKQEIGVNEENSDELVTSAKQSKLEVPKTSRKASISPKKLKTVKKELEINADIKKEPTIKQEIDIKEESSDEFVASSTHSKLEVPETSRKASISPKKLKTVKKELKINADIKKETNVGDIENAGWEPSNWKDIWENILKMRKLYVAPVDSLGCEECPEKDAKPEVFRYQTLISVMLSSQTKDQVTFAATQRLIEHGLDVENILKTSDEKIGELIYPAGFWKSKVKFIKQTSQILKEQYNGDIPRTFKELCKLPGVGPKMANIVMSVGWNDTVGIAVDTHVHRISNRLGWVPKTTKDAEQTRKYLESWLPKDLWRPINITLVGFGQTICKPVSPSCEICLNKNICPVGKTVLSGKIKKK